MLRFRTFGTIDLRREDGGRVEELLGQPKRLALLAYLADRQHSGPVRREQILTLLWPESAPSSARHALSSTLSRLRHTLGEEVIRGRGEETLWLSAEHFRSDVAAFQDAIEAGRPREALDLYRGPFLEGFRPPNSRPFEEWMENRREAFRSRAYEAGLEAGEAGYERGDLEAAGDCFRRSHEIDPLKEEAAEQLIRVLAEQGKRGEALKCYEAFTDRLRAELDLEPSSELQGLGRDVRSSEPGEQREPKPQPAPEPVASSTSSTEPGRSQRRWAAVGLLVLLTATGLFLGLQEDNESAEGEAGGTADVPVIAVLPFEGRASPEGRDGLRRGLTEAILTELALIDDIDVVSWSSVQPYASQDLRAQAVAESLGVSHVIAGRFQPRGDSIEVDIRLVPAQADQAVRYDSLTQHRSELVNVESKVALQVADLLQTTLPPEERRRIEAAPTDEPAAYRLYLRARELDETSPADNRTAIELYRQSIASDSNFAPAYAGLAEAFATQAQYGAAGNWRDSAYRAAGTALAIDSTLAEAHESLGQILLGKGHVSAGVEHLRRAVALKPGLLEALTNLMVARSWQGYYADALRLNWLRLAKNPRGPEPRRGMAVQLHGLKEDSAAEQWYDHAVALGATEHYRILIEVGRGRLKEAHRHFEILQRNSSRPDRVRQWAGLLAQTRGETSAARRHFRDVFREFPEAILMGIPVRLRLAQTLLATGSEEEARQLIQHVRQESRQAIDSGNELGGVRFNLAAAELLLGNNEAAVRWLNRAAKAGLAPSYRVMRNDPVWSQAQGEPAFEAFLKAFEERAMRQREEAKRWAREHGIPWPPLPENSPVSTQS